MIDEKHNGWSNYATWRINLEIFDAIQWVKEDFVPDEQIITAGDLALIIADIADDHVSEQNTLEGPAIDYARAFLAEVNWYEIAKHMAEENPDWKIKID